MSSFLPDTNSDRQIKEYIKKNMSFSVVAGAGSGKTTSLVKALEFVRSHFGGNLRKNGQRVACITFTNRAVDVIKSRLNSDDLFLISTLHSFIWSEIHRYQIEIKEILKKKLIPKRIEEKKEKDNGGQSKAALAARKRVSELESALTNIDQVEEFTYDESEYRNYESGQLDHDDVIDLTSLMISEIQTLRKILGQKYPYIFVDEAQDTFPSIIDALNLIAEEKHLQIVGYFGDPMQQIYDDRAGNFAGPEESVKIDKIENYRCSKEVIKLLNSFRTDVNQVPAGDNKIGSVKIVLVKAEKGQGPRKTYTDEQVDRALKKFDKSVEMLGWLDTKEIKKLFLSREMISRRLGFLSLNKLFNGEFASRKAKESYESGKNYFLKPFIKVLVPIVCAEENKNHSETFQILKRNSPLLNPTGENSQEKIKNVVRKANASIDQLTKAWSTKNIKDILILSNKLGLITLSDRLTDHLQRPKRTEEYDEDKYSKEKGDWLVDRFFAMSTSELKAYINFITDETPFSTQHGVKGEQYEKVLVFYDDTEAKWNKFSFTKLLTPIAVGKGPTEGQKTRSQKLAYVSFSRAKEDLGIILFTPDPLKSKTELMEQKYFSEYQIEILN